jgi:hypothetical protein
MPRNPDYFSPSQVRTRLRRVLQPYTHRGGGISLKVLIPYSNSLYPPLPTYPHPAEQDAVELWTQNYEDMTLRTVKNVSRISQVLAEHPDDYCRVNRVWHIAVVGKDSTRAFSIYIGNHTSPAYRIFIGADWLFTPSPDDLLRTSCLTTTAVEDYTRETSRTRRPSSTSTPPDAEVEL